MQEYEKIYAFENLYNAHQKVRRGKGEKESAIKFEVNALEGVLLLEKQLKTKTYTLAPYHCFNVYEPKERLVMANSYKDKVVQHSLCDNVLEPILTKSFIYDNYAAQKGKGTDLGLQRLKYFMQRYYRVHHTADGWVVKCDIKKYFYNIRHDVLKAQLRKFISCSDTLWLLDMIIDSTEGNVGIPIGNQSSQLFALLYLSGLDHYIKEKLGVKFYGRYMDDFYLIFREKDQAKECLNLITEYIEDLGLSFNNKTQIYPLRNGIDFLGFHTYLTDSGKVVMKLRRGSKTKMRRCLKKNRKLLDQRGVEYEHIRCSYVSWRGHALRGDCYHLIKEMDALYKELFKKEELKYVANFGQLACWGKD